VRGGLAGVLAAVLVRAERQVLHDLYEETFDHAAFTGRSGSFYAYEGLGSIYWHQVSKLLLAVRDLADGAGDGAGGASLEERYAELRRGLGTHRSPAQYGAFPTDPYSHTPSFAGAQQPGMTGQAKEDFLARLAELGVRVDGGRLHLGPTRSAALDLLEAPAILAYVDPAGEARTLELEPGTLALTCYQVPVVLHAGGEPRLVLTSLDSSRREVEGLVLDAETSAALFERRAGLLRVDVHGR